jgi:1-deoxy-D-xylulose-5-phosphate reductoisomerase
VSVALLGCTGSIGRQAQDVLAAHPDRFEVVALVAGRDERGLRAAAARFPGARAGLGAQAALQAATAAEVVLNAIVGAAGLRASVAALRAGATLALANKESLVAGGEVCLAAAEEGGGRIVPVDSEHAALATCLEGREPASVSRIVLTASGGPFLRRADLAGVTVAEALAHPTWDMGKKITIDSATLMNKGLEVIEAHHLFGLPYERIGVVVHPQSIVHGIVELADGTTVMQAAPPDMRLPIQMALAHPERLPSPVAHVDLGLVGGLTFEEVDRERFPALDLAYRAGRAGSTYPAVLNAANEVAVQGFLEGRCAFADIAGVVEACLDAHEGGDASTLEGVLEADRWARSRAAALLARSPAVAGRSRPVAGGAG